MKRGVSKPGRVCPQVKPAVLGSINRSSLYVQTTVLAQVKAYMPCNCNGLMTRVHSSKQKFPEPQNHSNTIVK
jgi:hypothetical protein